MVLCKILCLHVLIIAAFLIKMLTAEAVVELLLVGIKLHCSSSVSVLDLGFDVKSCNWCEAALPARISFKSNQHYCFYFPQIYFFI